MKIDIHKVRQAVKCVIDEVQYIYCKDGSPCEYFTDEEIDILIIESLHVYNRNEHMIPFFAAYKLIGIFLHEFDSMRKPDRIKQMWADMLNIELIRLNHKNLSLLIDSNPNDYDFCYKVLKK